MNDCVILDPHRTFDPELGSSSSTCRGGLRRHHPRGHRDGSKRCTNDKCNTSHTPMWRRGPFGPKTLCNACGIKYRKEEEKRRTNEATNNFKRQND
ncbi:GATA domain-containing protein [Cephalotus follicularis]|uniref:GATA domain-containing protein n=1 Tax=Cephalotus follicularis TaxID=3775 RepID=A0A1Q3B4S9_CEPFO|nr:GATA domain-containing protein [Cephalotus follicularis]